MNSLSTSQTLCADLRSMDPAAYITAIGLQPEDSYGFVPVEHSDGSALLYVYRDRASYAEARSGLAAPARSRLLGGMVEVDRPDGIELDLGGLSPAQATGPIAEALAMAQAFGAPSMPPAASAGRRRWPPRAAGRRVSCGEAR